jgi:hypothetical protein
MKTRILRLIAITCLWLGLNICVHADDFYFYVEHGNGSVGIGGNTFYGGSATNFLGYPCTYSVVYNGFGAQWYATVDSNAAIGVYDTGAITGGGEEVWVEIY